MTEQPPSPANIGRALAALRRRVPLTCPWCGETVQGKIRQAVYCSVACANAAYWDRHRAELNERARERYYAAKGEEPGGLPSRVSLRHLDLLAPGAPATVQGGTPPAAPPQPQTPKRKRAGSGARKRSPGYAKLDPTTS